MQNDALDRLMVQAMMCYHQVRQVELHKLFEAAAREAQISRSLSDQIERTEATVNKVGMALRKAKDNNSGEWMYVLVSTSGELGCRNSALPPSAGTVIQEILGLIFEDDRLEGVSRRELNSIANKDALTQVLAYLTQSGWLDEQQGIFQPTLRLFLELQPYLLDLYGDKTIFKCLGCEEWVLKGDLCTNRECHARLHTYCYSSYFSQQQKPEGICTECGSAFPSSRRDQYEEQTIRDSPQA